MFDSHICFAAASPIKMKDGSARIYYMGGNGPHNGARNSSLALATLNSWDQFASVSGSGNVTLMKLKVTRSTGTGRHERASTADSFKSQSKKMSSAFASSFGSSPNASFESAVHSWDSMMNQLLEPVLPQLVQSK